MRRQRSTRMDWTASRQNSGRTTKESTSNGASPTGVGKLHHIPTTNAHAFHEHRPHRGHQQSNRTGAKDSHPRRGNANCNEKDRRSAALYKRQVCSDYGFLQRRTSTRHTMNLEAFCSIKSKASRNPLAPTTKTHGGLES